MRYRLLIGAVLALLTLAALAACGGSSSETPPPLRPDPVGFRYGPSAPARVADASDAGAAPRTLPELADPEPRPRGHARSTWGTGSP